MSEKVDKKKGVRRVVLSVASIDCVTCALVVERTLKKLNGIEGVGSAVLLNIIFVDFDESKIDVPAIMSAMKKSGYSNYVAKIVSRER